MPEPLDLDRILRDWPFQPGVISARAIRTRDGRDVIQMRIELGVIQMEVEGRPDGTRPGGAETYLDHLIQESIYRGEGFELSDEQCVEADQEFLQFYHRRICWLALREFDRAVEDADHTLALMDFVAAHSSDEEWLVMHEQYRPFVLFHRTQAAALSRLESDGPEGAIETINDGLARIHEVFERFEGEEEDFDEDEMVGQLRELQEWLREHYDVGRTLSEQLSDAIATEQYELAARLRDEINRRHSKRP
jgi:hypothetical protein